MISTLNIIGQVLTFVSYLIFWISRFIKDKKGILAWDNISRIVAIIAFLFLGTYDGIKNSIYVMLRNLLGQITDKKDKRKKIITAVGLLILLLIMYSINFQGILTICIAICSILNLYGVIMCREQGIRIFGMIGSMFYTAFMALSSNITGVVCEIICFMCMLVSYIKYKDKEKKRENNEEQSNI